MFTTLPLQHEPYRRLWQRFCYLEKWLELAVRPAECEEPGSRDLGSSFGALAVAKAAGSILELDQLLTITENEQMNTN